MGGHLSGQQPWKYFPMAAPLSSVRSCDGTATRTYSQDYTDGMRWFYATSSHKLSLFALLLLLLLIFFKNVGNLSEVSVVRILARIHSYCDLYRASSVVFIVIKVCVCLLGVRPSLPLLLCTWSIWIIQPDKTKLPRRNMTSCGSYSF